MADITKLGFTTPVDPGPGFQPNTGRAEYDTNQLPELHGHREVTRMTSFAPVPSTLVILESTSANELRITLDLPVLPASATEQHGATDFDFASPFTGSTQRQFVVPIVASATFVSVSAVVAAASQVKVTFAAPITLTPGGGLPGAWSVTAIGGAAPLTVSAVAPDVDGVSINLAVSAMTTGLNNYTLHIPIGAIVSVDNKTNLGSNVVFSGSDNSPTVLDADDKSSTTVMVTYSEEVEPLSATNLANYVFAPPLSVLAVARLSATRYLVTTSPQQPNTVYNLTISNVTDLAGNPI